METLEFSLILALYNEGFTLPQSFNRIFKVLNKSNLKYEVILIDDRSQDQTVELTQKAIAERNNCRFYQHKENVGRGGTVSEGFRLARGKVIGFIDVDLEIGPEYMPDFVDRILREEAEGVTGLRRYKFTFSSTIRFFSTVIYHQLIKLLLGLPFRDTETGYKFFNREKVLPVLDKVKDQGWFWDTEIMAQSLAANLKIKEIPVVFKRRLDKKSTVKIFKDSWDYLIKLIKFSQRFQKK